MIGLYNLLSLQLVHRVCRPLKMEGTDSITNSDIDVCPTLACTGNK